jgi:glucose/arabinose dehydrogenase
MKQRHAAARLVRRSVKSRGPARIDALESRRLLTAVPTGFVDASFGGTFANGTAMAFAPDGRAFALSQNGNVRVIQPNGTATTAATLNVNSYFERGLLGIAFSPTFASDNQVYLYYTEVPAGQTGSSYTGVTRNRISRFTVTGNTINTASETLIVQLDQVSAGNHNGGAIHFGPDGKLYVAVGENAVSSNSQSLNTRLGKILRYNADGTIPSDNPTTFAGLAGTTTGANRAIWAVGLRNPFTFTFDPAIPGRMYINDVGQNTWEEINVGVAGANYGWPSTEGFFTQSSFPNFTRPLYSYVHGSGNQSGFCIAGGIVYRSSAAVQFPTQYQGKYFFGEYVNNWINTIDPAAPPTTTSSAPIFGTGANGIVDMQMGPDGAVYYLQRGTTAGARRISVNPALAPSIIEHPQDTGGTVGGSATFTVNAVGSAGTLGYQWQRNGVDISGANAATYIRTGLTADDDGALFRVIVTNTAGTAISNAATLTVTAANTAPVPTIIAPAAGLTYRAGQTYSFAGGATDAEDGTVATSGLSWRIDFHHDIHTHPFFPDTSGISGGDFVIPTTGEVAANVFYRIYLTATDSGGASTTVFRDIVPETSTFTLAVSGVAAGGAPTLLLDGQPIAAATSTLGVVGVQRTIEAPSSFDFNGQTYNFVSWSDGGTRAHDIATPEDDTIYTAVYLDGTAPARIGDGTFSRERLAAGAPPHSVTFGFSEAVITSASALTLVNTTTGQTVPAASILATSVGNNVVFSFPGYAGGVLPNGNYSATFSMAGVTDQAGNAVGGKSAVVNFRVLAGDADNNANVGFSDLVILAQNYNTTGRTFAEGNFNYSTDGLVDFADLVILAQNYDASLVQSAAMASVTPVKTTKPKRPANDVL